MTIETTPPDEPFEGDEFAAGESETIAAAEFHRIRRGGRCLIVSTDPVVPDEKENRFLTKHRLNGLEWLKRGHEGQGIDFLLNRNKFPDIGSY
ncbi:MAG: hypothetical protein V1852_02120 [Pseudomonadota bacterium]